MKKQLRPFRMPAIMLIAEERNSQREKHGYTKEFQLEHPEGYSNGELFAAAMFCFHPNSNVWPENWNQEAANKIKSKPRIEQLACAGAFIVSSKEMFGLTPSEQSMFNGIVEAIAFILHNQEKKKK